VSIPQKKHDTALPTVEDDLLVEAAASEVLAVELDVTVDND